MSTFETRHEVLIITECESLDQARRIAEELLDNVAFEHQYLGGE